jgi:uncharacterized membrane protein SpoIIM required for sporulation
LTLFFLTSCVLHLVLMPWISWLVVYKSLFIATNNDTENMYYEFKDQIYNFVNNCQQESLHFDLVMIQIIHFCILKILIMCGEFPHKIIP